MTSHPLPQAARGDWLTLDGVWEVELPAGTTPRPIRVPYTFESAGSGIGAAAEIQERLGYRRSCTAPERWRGRRSLLRFGAADCRATVFVDRRETGRHEGGYAHFTVDLGSLTGEHELVVEVEDPAADAFGQQKGKQRGTMGSGTRAQPGSGGASGSRRCRTGASRRPTSSALSSRRRARPTRGGS